MRLLWLLVLAMLLAAGCVTPASGAGNGSGNAPAAGVLFLPVDLWLDSGAVPLAAYQVELTYDANSVKIVGLEGGTATAYSDAPYYDRAGFEGGRIIVAAFTTEEEGAPRGKVRVARLHLAVAGGVAPDLTAKLMSAARPGGTRIEVDVQLKPSGQGE